MPWFRLAMAQRDYVDALKLAEGHRQRDKLTASYMAALVHLARNQHDQAAREIDVLEEAHRGGRKDKQLQHRIWETRGLLLCQTDAADAGLKLLAKVVDATKDDYSHHAWGNGAYYMEVWGLAALATGRLDVAEEGFLEALAHDSGSVRGAMGMQIVCEAQGRTEEARHFGELARRYWKHAEVCAFDCEFTAIRQQAAAALQAEKRATSSTATEDPDR
jgi:tetratricopeptide (TPR) repeat protein